MKDGTVLTTTDSLMTPGQFRELASALVQVTPHNLPRECATQLIADKSAWQDEVRHVLWGKRLANSVNFGLERIAQGREFVSFKIYIDDRPDHLFYYALHPVSFHNFAHNNLFKLPSPPYHL